MLELIKAFFSDGAQLITAIDSTMKLAALCIIALLIIVAIFVKVAATWGRALVVLALVGAMLIVFGMSVSNAQRPIVVVAGSYGLNNKAGGPGARGNATKQLIDSCQGKSDCVYEIKLPDFYPGPTKNYVAEWTCGNSVYVRKAGVGPDWDPGEGTEAGWGRTVRLYCD